MTHPSAGPHDSTRATIDKSPTEPHNVRYRSGCALLAMLLLCVPSLALAGCTGNPMPNTTSTSSASNTLATVAAVVTAADQFVKLETADGVLKGGTASTLAADVAKTQAALTDLQTAYSAYQSLVNAANQSTFAAKAKAVLSVLGTLNTDLVASGVEHAALGTQVAIVISSVQLLVSLIAPASAELSVIDSATAVATLAAYDRDDYGRHLASQSLTDVGLDRVQFPDDLPPLSDAATVTR